MITSQHRWQWLLGLTAWISCSIFFFSGALKLLSLFSGSGVLRNTNPVFIFLSNWEVLGISGTLELTVATIAFLRRKSAPIASSGLIIWMASLILLYRIALEAFGFSPKDCNCLGSLGKTLFPSGGSSAGAWALLFALVGSNFCAVVYRLRHASRSEGQPDIDRVLTATTRSEPEGSK